MFHISLPGSFSIPTSAGLSAGLLSGLSSLERPHFSYYTRNKQQPSNKEPRYVIQASIIRRDQPSTQQHRHR